ncbi:hypothetical protein [Nocardioides lianchengensis]|uniref:Lipoprotein n=1 Tax=Nocardioides lianchengensis TaxID=1045774 RepID=A0A1G6ILJ3_9ACTN|nr:hypothetical protein [Nocardioides lianchengensis]NYG13006.1 hypothetical protein [Nocardioides lianchengensis]SDC07368.1 hypothetical protein SAMN05421872_101220 [Nocardioides lianchengensis]
MRRLLALALLVPLLAGCEDGREQAARTYDGPLFVTRAEATHPEAGAAGDVVDCDTWGTGGFEDAEVYGEGATADSAEQALEWGEHGPYGLDPDDLRVAAETDDRVLYVVEADDGTPKQALVVHDGEGTEGAGGDGWYVESWAQCDPVELPAYAEEIGLQVWTDADGRPVPKSGLEAWVGPEHCGWESMVFLYLGGRTYVREPQRDLWADYFTEKYAAHVTVPADAVDTGFERDGDHLWLAADRSRAYVGARDDAELWPATVQDLGCA